MPSIAYGYAKLALCGGDDLLRLAVHVLPVGNAHRIEAAEVVGVHERQPNHLRAQRCFASFGVAFIGKMDRDFLERARPIPHNEKNYNAEGVHAQFDFVLGSG